MRDAMSGPYVRNTRDQSWPVTRTRGSLTVEEFDHPSDPGGCRGSVETPSGIVRVWQFVCGEWNEDGTLAKAGEWTCSFSLISNSMYYGHRRDTSRPYTALGLTRIASKFAAEAAPA